MAIGQPVSYEPAKPPRASAARMSPQAAVAELGQAALGGLEASRVFDLAVGLLCAVLNVEYSAVLHELTSGEPPVIMAGAGWGDEIEPGETTVPNESGSQAEFTLASDEPVIFNNLPVEKRFQPWPLLLDLGVMSGMSVMIPDRFQSYGLLTVFTTRRRSFTAGDADFLRSIAHVIGGAVQNDRFMQRIETQARSQERRMRYQAALTDCAQALLGSSGDDHLQLAAQAMLQATEADAVFIKRNVQDPELGFCSRTVAEVHRPGTPAYGAYSDYWNLVPWDRMPSSLSQLSRGELFVIIPEELEGVEYELYAADPFPLKSVLDIPIQIDGAWEGLIAFGDISVARDWAREDWSLLAAAAQMVGAFWEREMDRDHLRQLLISKDELIASISHELRTPLTSVVGFARVLQMDGSGLSAEERAEIVNTIAEEGTDLANIVDDLLVAAKADTGTLAVAEVSVSLRAQAAQVLEVWPPEEAAIIKLSGTAEPAWGDPARVRQILRNLVANAIRYGGSDIRIVVSSDASTARVTVVDDGPGMPEEARQRVFDSSERGEKEPGLVRSVGLGLTISHHLAQRMGGSLTYRYEGGQSIFELTLPRAD